MPSSKRRAPERRSADIISPEWPRTGSETFERSGARCVMSLINESETFSSALAMGPSRSS